MKRRLLIPLSIFALALAARLAVLYYFMVIRGLTPLDFSTDAIQYHHLALSLLGGDWSWSSDFFGARPPLMPLLVAGIYALLGPVQLNIALANALLGAATAPVAYAVTHRLSDDRRIAGLTAALVAFDPPSIANNINMQAETLTNFCLALMLLALAHALQRQRLRDGLLAGLWLALASLARPTTIYLFAFYLPVFWLLIQSGRWRLYLAFAVLPLAVFLGWSMRNQTYLGVYTYTTVSDFNLLFYRAVSVERWARGGVSDDTIRREFALEIEQRLGNPLAEAAVDSNYFWRNFAPRDGRRLGIMRTMALQTYQAHPGWYIALIPPGLVRMYGYTALYGNPWWPEIGYHLLFYGLALLGVVACWRQRAWPVLALTLTPIGYVTLATIVSQTTGMDTRMRTSLTVVLAVLAAWGLLALWAWVRQRPLWRGQQQR